MLVIEFNGRFYEADITSEEKLLELKEKADTNEEFESLMEEEDIDYYIEPFDSNFS